MINANAPITRCVRSALLTHCAEIIIPSGHLSANSPENISQALDQVVSLINPRMAAAIMAMQPNSIPPGDAAIIQNYFNELLKRKTNASAANGTPTTTR